MVLATLVPFIVPASRCCLSPGLSKAIDVSLDCAWALATAFRPRLTRSSTALPTASARSPAPPLTPDPLYPEHLRSEHRNPRSVVAIPGLRCAIPGLR